MALLFIDKVTENRSSFEKRVEQIASELGVNPNWLMFIMFIESGLNHRIVNSIGATGLIQFTRTTAQGLGTTTDALRNMSNVEQLTYVKKYYQSLGTYRGMVIRESVYDLYLATFYPAAIGKTDDYVFPPDVIKYNASLDFSPKDGKITLGEFKRFVDAKIYKFVPTSFYTQFFEKKSFVEANKKQVILLLLGILILIIMVIIAFKLIN